MLSTLGLAVFLLVGANAAWTMVNPPLTTSTFTSVAFGGGVYVAVASFPPVPGQVFNQTTPSVVSSTDARRWKPFAVPAGDTVSDWFTVIYNDNTRMFFIFGNGQSVWSSPNGESWTLKKSNIQLQNTRTGVNRVAYGNGRFAVVAQMKLFASIDGINWQLVQSAYTDGVTFAGGMFVSWARGMLSTKTVAAFTSNDTTTWAPISLPSFEGPDYMKGLGRANFLPARGPFAVAVATDYQMDPTAQTMSRFMLSIDNGKTWTVRSARTNQIGDVEQAGAYYFKIMSGQMFYSSNDGTSFNTYDPPLGQLPDLLTIMHAGNFYFALNVQGTIATASSISLGNWNAVQDGIQGRYGNLMVLQNTFLLSTFDPSRPGTPGENYHSTDGVTWRLFSRLRPSNVFVGDSNQMCIQESINSTWSNTVQCSRDFQRFTSHTLARNFPGHMVDATHAGGFYFYTTVNTTSGVFTLWNGNTLTATFRAVLTSSGSGLEGWQVTFANGVYAVLFMGVVQTSTDLHTFTRSSQVGPIYSLYQVGPVLFAEQAANMGNFWVSKDGGKTYAAVNVPDKGVPQAFANGVYYAVSAGGTVSTSTDGVTFRAVDSPPVNTFDTTKGIAVARGKVLVASNTLYMYSTNA